MPLFVQIADKHHRVTAFEPTEEGTAGQSSMVFKRSYTLGCGKVVIAPAHALYEAEAPAWAGRHVAKGCFDTADDGGELVNGEFVPKQK